MEDQVIQLIVAVSGLLSSVGAILGFFVAKFHLGKKVQVVADSLQETDNWVAENEVQLKTGIKVAAELSPEAQKLIDDHKAELEAVTKELEQKKAALDELRKVLPPAS